MVQQTTGSADTHASKPTEKQLFGQSVLESTVVGAGVLAAEVIQAVRQPLVILDDQMRVQATNSAFDLKFSVVGQPLRQASFYSINDCKWDTLEVRGLLERVWKFDSTFDYADLEADFRMTGDRMLRLSARPLFTDELCPRLMVVGIEDRTERFQIDHLAEQSIEKLQTSNHELEDFAYIASHDLQEPLRAIQAFGERLSKRISPSLADEDHDSLERMLRAAARMRTLIDDLLQLSRISTDAKPYAPVSLNDALRQSWNSLSQRVGETGSSLEVDPLPTVIADASQVRQLFQNLFENAIKYRREDVAPVIAVRCRATTGGDSAIAGDGFVIDVNDNGIGFDMQYMEKIFAPFRRLHGRSKYEGSGIGLALCRKIAARHGWQITAVSTPGIGSCFSISGRKAAGQAK